ncbi:MAG: hypothetical protein Q7T51_02870 [Candidatus Moranbacteria bacterium]|nr:hypothetical protein [Candidatus Moranbacteria bacterium]
MATTKKKNGKVHNKGNDISEAYYFIMHGCANPAQLKPHDWLILIDYSLKACASVMRKVAEERGSKAVLMKDILNCSVEGGEYGEKRITPDEVIRGLPGALTVNDKWLFIPVRTLESREKDGKFFERRLFILADFAHLLIVDVVFRKEPQPNQREGIKKPLFDEHVLECKVMIDKECLSMKADGFFEIIMRHLGHSKDKLGEYIIKNILEDAVTELRKIRSKTEKIQKEMQPFLDLRRRLGISDCI